MAVFLNFKVWLAYKTPGKWVPTSAGNRAAIKRPGRMGDEDEEEEGDLWIGLWSPVSSRKVWTS
jgi:hypothetical protein